MPETPGQADEQTFLLESLRRLEEEHRSGALTDDEYRVLRDQQTIRAAALLKQEEDVAIAPNKAEPRTVRLNKKRRSWATRVGVAAFVAVATLSLFTSIGERLSGDTGTGDIVADSNTLLQRAREQTANQRADQAVRTYDQVLRLDADNAEALAYRGWLLRLAGLSDVGLQSIDKAVAADPSYPDARFFKGFILLRDRQQPAAAVKEFEAFLANNPPPQLVPLVEQALADARTQAAAAAAG